MKDSCVSLITDIDAAMRDIKERCSSEQPEQRAPRATVAKHHTVRLPEAEETEEDGGRVMRRSFASERVKERAAAIARTASAGGLVPMTRTKGGSVCVDVLALQLKANSTLLRGWGDVRAIRRESILSYSRSLEAIKRSQQRPQSAPNFLQRNRTAEHLALAHPSVKKAARQVQKREELARAAAAQRRRAHETRLAHRGAEGAKHAEVPRVIFNISGPSDLSTPIRGRGSRLRLEHGTQADRVASWLCVLVAQGASSVLHRYHKEHRKARLAELWQAFFRIVLMIQFVDRWRHSTNAMAGVFVRSQDPDDNALLKKSPYSRRRFATSAAQRIQRNWRSFFRRLARACMTLVNAWKTHEMLMLERLCLMCRADTEVHISVPAWLNISVIVQGSTPDHAHHHPPHHSHQPHHNHHQHQPPHIGFLQQIARAPWRAGPVPSPAADSSAGPSPRLAISHAPGDVPQYCARHGISSHADHRGHHSPTHAHHANFTLEFSVQQSSWHHPIPSPSQAAAPGAAASAGATGQGGAVAAGTAQGSSTNGAMPPLSRVTSAGRLRRGHQVRPGSAHGLAREAVVTTPPSPLTPLSGTSLAGYGGSSSSSTMATSPTSSFLARRHRPEQSFTLDPKCWACQRVQSYCFRRHFVASLLHRELLIRLYHPRTEGHERGRHNGNDATAHHSKRSSIRLDLPGRVQFSDDDIIDLLRCSHLEYGARPAREELANDFFSNIKSRHLSVLSDLFESEGKRPIRTDLLDLWEDGRAQTAASMQPQSQASEVEPPSQQHTHQTLNFDQSWSAGDPGHWATRARLADGLREGGGACGSLTPLSGEMMLRGWPSME